MANAVSMAANIEIGSRVADAGAAELETLPSEFIEPLQVPPVSRSSFHCRGADVLPSSMDHTSERVHTMRDAPLHFAQLSRQAPFTSVTPPSSTRTAAVESYTSCAPGLRAAVHIDDAEGLVPSCL